MSTNQMTNAFVPGGGVDPPAGQGRGDSVSKSAKIRRRKAAKKAERLAADATKPGESNAVQKQVQTGETPSKSKQEPQHGKSGVSPESLNTEAEAKKIVPLSSESSSPARPLSHSKATLSYQGTYSDTAENNGSSHPENSAATSPSSGASAIVDQPLDNLLEMIRPQRQALLTGPQISIRIGNTSVTGIYKRAAMAASASLQQHFSKHPESLEYYFTNSEVSSSAVHFLLVEWMHETCNEFEAYAVPAQKSFEDDVAVLCVARLLRMERYCRHTRAEYLNYLKTCLPSYEEIAIVEKNATGDRHPLWTAMVNHLRYERLKGRIPDPEEFEKFLEEHTRLKKAMEVADKVFARKAKQRAENREEERRQHKEKHETERHEREAHDRRTAASLRKKLGDASSGLMTVTADEAEMLRDIMSTR